MPSLLAGELGSVPEPRKAILSVSLNALSVSYCPHPITVTWGFLFCFVFKGESVATPMPKKAECKMLCQTSVRGLELECLPQAPLPSSELVGTGREAPGRQAPSPGVMCLFYIGL